MCVFKKNLSLKKLVLLVSLLYSSILCAQPTPKPRSNFARPDVPACYPDGIEMLFEFISKHLSYPADARLREIEGTVYIEFIIDKSGIIKPHSVKVIVPLHPSCDAEGLRVVKMIPQWKPALKNNQPIDSKIVLPLVFDLVDDGEQEHERTPGLDYKIGHPIPAVVKEKLSKSSLPDWSIYEDNEMDSVSGKIHVGDTVEIINWSYHLYYIKNNKIQGYISSLALFGDSKFDSLASIVSTYKNIEDIHKIKKPTTFIDTSEEGTYLSLHANKKSVYVGECVTVSLNLNVSNEKWKMGKMQFVDMDIQMKLLLSKYLKPNFVWRTRSPITEIKGELLIINEDTFNTYPIYKASYCPTSTQSIVFPAMPMKLIKYWNASGSNFDTIQFNSKPLSIKVNTLPQGVSTSTYDFFKMTGSNYTLLDKLLANDIVTNQPVLYKITLFGEALNFPIEAPKLSTANINAKVINTAYKDTLIDERYYSERTFIYSLTFNKVGKYSFGDKVSFTYFDPIKKSVVKLNSNMELNVTQQDGQKLSKSESLFDVHTNLMLLDISTSMMMEDYKPNRLSAVVKEIKAFLKTRQRCDIGMVTFSGEATPYKMSKIDSCYSNELINAIHFVPNVNGTAIGDAIFMAKQVLRQDPNSKFVIISDGDNTNGISSIEMASAIAKKHNIKIYTIGVGTKGLVPLGKDTEGRPLFCPNSFSDIDLKKISSITGGKYYWAKDPSEIRKILNLIFP